MKSQWIALWRRLRALVERRRLERELDEELAFHRSMRGALNCQRFGNDVRIREQAREAWVFGWLETLGQDLRYAVRALRRTPAFTVGVTAMLALGIGVNSAIFSLAYGVLWKPLPYPDAGRIVVVRQGKAHSDYQNMYNSMADIRVARQADVGLSEWVRFRYDQAALTGTGTPVTLSGVQTEAGLFPLLGAKPLAGRLLLPSDDGVGKPPVVVINAGLWRERWAASPAVLGRTIHLDGKPYTVVGVLPDSFDFPPRSRSSEGEYWRAWQDKEEGFGARDIPSLARLAPGVTLAAAQARLDQEMMRLAATHPDDRGWRFHITPMRQHMVSDVAGTLGIMLAVVGGVLLIAAVNLAALLMARAQTRRRELATRAALGASRARIARQLLTETGLLLIAGTAAGLGLAAAGIAWLRWQAPSEMPRIGEVGMNWPVAGFAVALALLVGAMFGLAPAVRASAVDWRGAKADRASRGRGALVAVQVGLTLALLAGSGLMLKAFVRRSQVPLGFALDHALSFQLAPPPARYTDAAARQRLYDRVLSGLRALPGVEQVGIANAMPLDGDMGTAYALPGHPFKLGDGSQNINFAIVNAGFFPAMEMPVVAGRGFQSGDVPGSEPVAVINQTAARQLFAGKNPLGERIGLSWPKEPEWRTIVGVVGDVNEPDGDAPTPAPAAAYIPTTQTEALEWPIFVVRSAGNPEIQLPAVRRVVAEMDAALPVLQPETLRAMYADAVAEPRFRTGLVAAFASLALLLTVAGLYSLLSYSVAGRTREFGVRSALGARPRQVMAQVLRQALALTALGVAAGLGAAWGLTRLLAGLLYGVSPTDGWVLGSVTGLLLAAGLAAACGPARRAMRVDAAEALRCD